MANINRPTISNPAAMAALPLPAQAAPTTAPDSPKAHDLQWTLLSFTMNGKQKDYPNDDGYTTRKLATAKIKQANGTCFVVSIYHSVKRTKVAGGVKVDRETYTSLPASGKFFASAVFTSDDPVVNLAMRDFKLHVANEYKAWAKANTPAGLPTSQSHASDRIVESEIEAE